MKIHYRNTYQDGANRMILDHSWHSSTPLKDIRIGDVLRIKNRDTFEVVDWKVTEPASKLDPKEAKDEWEKYPFGDLRKAERFNFYPHIIHNLENIKEYPPQKPSPRFIPSEVRIKVWVRDEGKCKHCGSRESLEFDHIIPVSIGGSNTEKNIEVLCRKCNREKSGKIK